jgi:hypothetical protein
MKAPKMKMTTPIPQQIMTPDSVETRLGTLNFFDGFPDEASVEKVMNNLDFSRGVQAFLSAMPGASLVGMRTGFKKRELRTAPCCSMRPFWTPNPSISQETPTLFISAPG